MICLNEQPGPSSRWGLLFLTKERADLYSFLKQNPATYQRENTVSLQLLELKSDSLLQGAACFFPQGFLKILFVELF